MKKEIWKDILGYEGLYRVSNLGRVKSLARELLVGEYHAKVFHPEMILKPFSTIKGYLLVDLRYNGKRKTRTVHRLVLQTFVGESKLECNHKNGIKTDNRLENLEYVTGSVNVRHAFDIGLKKALKGELHSMHKLTQNQVYRIKWIKKNVDTPLGYWTKLAKSLNVSGYTISDITRNKSWKHIEV